jgi:hypothetical protein
MRMRFQNALGRFELRKTDIAPREQRVENDPGRVKVRAPVDARVIERYFG